MFKKIEPSVGSYAKEMAREEERELYEDVYGMKYYGPDDYDEFDEEFDDDEPSEYLDIYDAREYYISSGMDEDYTFGYSEEEFRDLK